MAGQRKDYRERRMLGQAPAQRVCGERFREDGILLPFGYIHDTFVAPNPTFFQSADWPMKDSADPLAGWALKDVLKADSGPATNDIYGKLYIYLHGFLSSFHHRLNSLKVGFELTNHAAEDLGKHLETGTFARIEVSNISDAGYLGCPPTVAFLSPLLQDRTANPHATLLTLFMNAVDEVTRPADVRASTVTELAHLLKFLPPPIGARNTNDSRAILINYARPMVRDMDKFFHRYAEGHSFKETEQHFRMTIKDSHTIIDKWPLRLKLQPAQIGAKEEFELVLSSTHMGTERYVEWKRAHC